jgi:5,10-methylene-tetrahydrofolate dehydrogenase/methenyl tetrahydrofolate cyclohydrolase
LSRRGKANAVTKEYLSPGQIVVDVGINMTDDGKLAAT